MKILNFLKLLVLFLIVSLVGRLIFDIAIEVAVFFALASTVVITLRDVLRTKSNFKSYENVLNDLVNKSKELSKDMAVIYSENNENLDYVSSQSVSTDQTSAAVSHISLMIEKSKDLLNECNQESTVVVEEVNEGNKVITDLKRSSSLIDDSSAKIQEYSSNMIDGLDEVIQTIESIEKKIGFINDIVFQTKLLSFNASVEAARAGENGKGFAVVADEIATLASSSGSNADSITKLVKSGLGRIIQIKSENAMGLNQIVTENIKNVQEVNRYIEQCSNKFFSIEKNINNLNLHLHNVVEAGREQLIEIKSIEESTNTLKASSQKNKENLDSSKAKLEVVKTSIESLSKIVADFTGVLHNRPIVNLEPKELYKSIDKFKIVDVRDENEWTDDLGHIKGSKFLSVNAPNFKDELKKMNKNSFVVFICRSGGRSARAARMSQEVGFKKIFNLNGGLLNWKKENLPTININN